MATRILVAVIFVPLLFIVLFFLPSIWLAAVVAGICAIASFELLRATRAADRKSLYAATALCAAAIPLAVWGGLEDALVPLAALVLMCVTFFEAIRAYDSGRSITLEHILVCLFGGLLIPCCLASLVELKEMERGRYLVLLPVISAFLTDAGAYFAGVFLGKHRGITRVSPNKSLEGYVGGIAAGVVFMLLYAGVLSAAAGLPVRALPMAVYGLVGSGVTELGDLAFSLIKRQYGIKDYGHLLPGHGGMLDRFDSMIFAAPALLLLVELFPPF